jgi:hypothetical protein
MTSLIRDWLLCAKTPHVQRECSRNYPKSISQENQHEGQRNRFEQVRPEGLPRFHSDNIW